MPTPVKKITTRLIGYFVKGLIVVLPIAICLWLFTSLIQWVDEFVNLGFPGSGLIIVLASVIFLGFLLSGLLGSIVFNLMDDVLSRIPFIKIIYTSVKDLIEAFVGEKKKFSEPVLVQISEFTQSIGFVTRHDVDFLDLPGKTAVYFPYSYSLTGRLLLVDKSNIKPLHVNAAEVMKFVVSGGVTGFHQD
jgi:uncharacterized membrane protein